MPELTEVTAGALADAVAGLLADSGDESCPPPGALLAVQVGTETAYAVRGFAQRIAGRPPIAMQWATRTDAGSVTKVVATTAALMALTDSGDLDLDAPIARWVAEFPGTVSVRDVLEHQAGLAEWWPLYLTGARGADALALAARLPLRYPPRTGRHYSDLGFMLLGEVVARATGGDLASTVDELVLRRFGLVETRYASPVPGAPVAASSDGDRIEMQMVSTGQPHPVDGAVGDFDRWRTHVLVGEVNDGNAFHAFDGVSGHAGLFTTAADLLRFATGLRRCLDGDGPLRPGTVTRFLTRGDDTGQALGLRVWGPPSQPAYGHTGFPGIAFAVVPDLDAAVVMITNRLHGQGTPRATEDMWLQGLAAARAHLEQR